MNISELESSDANQSAHYNTNSQERDSIEGPHFFVSPNSKQTSKQGMAHSSVNYNISSVDYKIHSILSMFLSSTGLDAVMRGRILQGRVKAAVYGSLVFYLLNAITKFNFPRYGHNIPAADNPGELFLASALFISYSVINFVRDTYLVSKGLHKDSSGAYIRMKPIPKEEISSKCFNKALFCTLVDCGYLYANRTGWAVFNLFTLGFAPLRWPICLSMLICGELIDGSNKRIVPDYVKEASTCSEKIVIKP